jgi:uncharacterized protein (TIGR02145 family)
MKRILLSLFGLILWTTLFSQVPNGFKYQAAIRDSEGNLLKDEQVVLTINIIQGDVDGSSVYNETHDITTNSSGLIDLQIGKGNPETFSSIAWNNGPYYIEIKMNGSAMGTSQLLSVPYALYAQSSASSENNQQRMDSLSDAWTLKFENLLQDQTNRFDSLTQAIDSLNEVLVSKANVYYTSKNEGFFIDERDNQKYQFTTIGDQAWMTENMNIGDTLNPGAFPTNNDTIEKFAYNDAAANLETYGGLYTWREMMQLPDSCEVSGCADLIETQHQGICPSGWHLPSQAEWQEMIDYLGGNPAGAGGKLKETGTAHWTSPNTGSTNTSGFTALPGGKKAGGFYLELGESAYFIITNEESAVRTYVYQLRFDSDQVNKVSVQKERAFSVRCIKD